MEQVKCRYATLDDVLTFVGMAREFYKTTPVAGQIPFNPLDCRKFIENGIIDKSVGSIVGTVDGEIASIACAIVYPMYYNHSHRVVQELAWYVSPDHRGKGLGVLMHDKIMEWGMVHDAKTCFMIALENEDIQDVSRLYRSQGYSPMERSFFKGI